MQNLYKICKRWECVSKTMHLFVEMFNVFFFFHKIIYKTRNMSEKIFRNN